MKRKLKKKRKTIRIRNMNKTGTVPGNLEDIVAEYRPRLSSYIRRRVSSKEDAEDILQDVFYQFTKTINSALNPVEQVASWLYRVANNTIINKKNKKSETLLSNYLTSEDDDEAETDIAEILGFVNNENPESEYLRSLVWVELENALAELPPEEREVFELTEFDGLPVKEISEMTGVAVNTLLSRKHYSILHLRESLSELYDELVMG